MVLDLVHGPDCALDVLHAHEALVKAQVVSHCVLQGRGMGQSAT